MSIPRLELSAAVLLPRLFAVTQPMLKGVNIANTYLFSDSTIVLAWLRTPPHTLKTFVANRVVEILDNTSPSMWLHIKSELNPADCPSRGLYPSEVINHPLWWSGPSFLKEPPSSWPVEKTLESEEVPERIASHVVTEDASDGLMYLLHRYSSMSKLVRVVAYIRRFVTNCRTVTKSNGNLTVKEYNAAKLFLIKLIQHRFFSKDLKLIRNGRLPSKGILKVTPFLDHAGLLRVGGRLKCAPLPDYSKHPLLLPAICAFVKLLCEETHRITLHGGPQLMLSVIQRHYWILGLRSALRKVVYSCSICYKLKAQTIQPIMADLPPSRFSQVRAFLQVGVDYAGPFTIKDGSRRKTSTCKAYVCLFVCMATKAVHVELVSNLSTPAFLAALDRFISRRGLCTTIHSDCGTNFVGAANELRTFLHQVTQEAHEHLGKRSIAWKFNPPSAPNFGGLWEAAVKSLKHHLIRIVGSSLFTFEEFYTLLTRIEAVLNSRPLCPLVNDPNDDSDALTPGHFLVGTSLLSYPEPCLSDIKPNLLSRWQVLSQSLHQFWNRWKTEYLQAFMLRNKWTKPVTPVSVGDLVLVTKEHTPPPLTWPIGRITNIQLSHDGVPRVAQVRIADKLFIRPFNRLIRFPPSEY